MWRLTTLQSSGARRGVTTGTRRVEGCSRQIVRGQISYPTFYLGASIHAKGCPACDTRLVFLGQSPYMICDLDSKLQCALQRRIPPDLSLTTIAC